MRPAPHAVATRLPRETRQARFLAVWTSRLATLVLAALAVSYALGDDNPKAALGAVARGLLILALTEGLKRGSQIAAGTLLVEPLLPEELHGYQSWLRVHGALTPRRS